MTDYDLYFEYLSHRSRLGHIYRRYFLYPRIAQRLVGKCLDIGCGIGDLLAYRPNTVGVDVNPRTVEYCCSIGLDAQVMNADVLPFEDGAFDSVLMDNVLEHISDPTRLLDDVHRVLKTGGCLLIGVPGSKGWASDEDHKVFYDERTLVSCLGSRRFRQTGSFCTPLVRSSFLDKKLRQYCIYASFVRA